MSAYHGTTTPRSAALRCAVVSGLVVGLLVAVPSVASARTREEGPASWQAPAVMQAAWDWAVELVGDFVHVEPPLAHGRLTARDQSCTPGPYVTPINIPIPEPALQRHLFSHVATPDVEYVTPINIPLPEPARDRRLFSDVATADVEYVTPINLPGPEAPGHEGREYRFAPVEPEPEPFPGEEMPDGPEVTPINIPLP